MNYKWDIYGFAEEEDGKENLTVDDRCHDYIHSVGEEVRLKWIRLLKKWNEYNYCTRQEKVKHLIKRGLPNDLRPEVWRKLLEIDQLQKTSSFCYEKHLHILKEQMKCLHISEKDLENMEHRLCNLDTPDVIPTLDLNILRQICLDTERTFPTHAMFMANTELGIEGQSKLFRILAIYAKYNPEIGYCQGMSFIAGTLLMYMDEKQAFWAFVALLERQKYLFNYFSHTLERIQNHSKVFGRVLSQHLPLLSNHLVKLGIDPLMYITPWLLCLYTCLPCWDSTLTIWDLLCAEGNVVLFQVAIAIMSLYSNLLLQQKDMNHLLPMLQKVPHEIVNRENLIPTIWKVKFEAWEIIGIQSMVNEENIKTDMSGGKELNNTYEKNEQLNLSRSFIKKITDLLPFGRKQEIKQGSCSPSKKKCYKYESQSTPRRFLSCEQFELISSSPSSQLAFRHFQTPLTQNVMSSPITPQELEQIRKNDITPSK